MVQVLVHGLRGKARVAEGAGGGFRISAALEDEGYWQCGVLGRHGPNALVGVGEQPDHRVDGRVGVESHQPPPVRVRVIGEASPVAHAREVRVGQKPSLGDDRAVQIRLQHHLAVDGGLVLAERDAVELVVRDYIECGHRTEARAEARDGALREVDVKPRDVEG
jgi:hypothetical protein